MTITASPPPKLDAKAEAVQDGPQLSIVIPAYNVETYIADAVHSALDQTFASFEVIVVDDGSTDGTSAILERLSSQRNDSRLRVITQANLGLSEARNTGVRHSRGDFIGFLDGDDLWLPQKATRQIELMLSDRTVGISFSDSEYLTDGGARTGNILHAQKSNPSLRDMIQRNHIGNGSTPIVRRECFVIAGLFRPELRSCEDYEMWCRILYMTNYRAQLIREPLTLYRLRASSLSFNSKKFVENADAAIAYIRAAMPDLPSRIIRAGHAEHYRIAAWKAVTSGRTDDARMLLKKAFSLRPLLPFIDWRAAFTAGATLVPMRFRSRFIDGLKSIRRRLRFAA